MTNSENNLKVLKGIAWLQLLCKFLNQKPLKSSIIAELGTDKPSNPYIKSLEILAKDEVVEQLIIHLKKEFELTEEQVMQAFEDSEPSQNLSKMRNELHIRPKEKNIVSIQTEAPLNTDFATAIDTICIELNQ